MTSPKLTLIIIVGVVLIVMVGGIIWMWSATVTPPGNNINLTTNTNASSNTNSSLTNSSATSVNDSTNAIDAELGNVNVGDVDQEFLNINADINQL